MVYVYWVYVCVCVYVCILCVCVLVWQVRYVDQGLVENIPVCHVYPALLCEDVPQLCVPCQLHGVIPVPSHTHTFQTLRPLTFD